MSEGIRLDELAHRLGLFGIEQATERKLIKTGNSLVVTIDPKLARETLGTSRPGVRLAVGRQGKKIVIEAVTEKKTSRPPA